MAFVACQKAVGLGWCRRVRGLSIKDTLDPSRGAARIAIAISFHFKHLGNLCIAFAIRCGVGCIAIAN